MNDSSSPSSLDIAGLDGFGHAQRELEAANYTGVALISATAMPEQCPKVGLCDESTGFRAPLLDIANAGMGVTPSYGWLANTSTDAITLFQDIYYNASSNFFQTMHAAVRLDIGNIYSNNILLNSSQTTIQQTIFPSANTLVPAVGDRGVNYSLRADPLTLYSVLLGLAPNLEVEIPLRWDGSPALLQVPYLCHFTVPKGAGEIFISVLVATLSMLGSAWAILQLGMGYAVKRRRSEGELSRL